MSNSIRYDALLVRDLAGELNRTLAGTRLEGASLNRESLRVTLRTRAGRRADPPTPSLIWQLHPGSGHLTTGMGAPATEGRVQLPAPAVIAGVSAPPDERVVIIELDARDAPVGVARRIIIELITNQWNAIATSADDRIIAVLRERVMKERTLRAGVRYAPPPGSTRPGAHEPIALHEWLDILGPVPTGERLRAVLRIAYVSPLNAAAVIGDADVSVEVRALERAHERYIEMVWTSARTPVLLQRDGYSQPYAIALDADATPASSLLASFDEAARLAAAAPAEPDAAEHALAAIAARLESLQRREVRLQAEQSGAADEAQRLRAHADLLMSQLHVVTRGASSVELDDFAGGRITIELDPTIDAARNAARLYDTARRRDRAAARIPALVAGITREVTRLEELAARVRGGTASDDELAQLQRARRADTREGGPALPYREYRTSSGIDVWVGRGSRANDDMTFRHARPTDIWLHARDVAGAHVILRWPHTESNPAASDIAEAAVLAALHSRARTSGTVAVDWTRRKYVRKPRKSAPGAVIPERVRTVFVVPKRNA